MLYKKIIRPILFRINPVSAYFLALKGLHALRKLFISPKLFNFIFKTDYPALKKDVFGIDFSNPVGLAAGLDKNGEFYNDLSACGFSFIEIGTITPKIQTEPADYDFTKVNNEKIIINNLGIANKGVISIIENLKKERANSIIAANIAHNSSSKDEKVIKDYETLVSLLYDFVDFFVVNASYADDYLRSPLEDPDILAEIMDAVLDTRVNMDSIKPILIKISSDIPVEQLDEILKYSMKSGVDGIVIGDGIKNKPGTLKKRFSNKKGYVCGSILYEKTLSMVKYINEFTKGRLPIIASGGIMTVHQAEEMIKAGASLIELMSGFIYEGPKLVRNILKQLDKTNNHV